MRAWVALALLALTPLALAKRILLIPLDSRPASGQFAQMIAQMADVQIQQPPYELLGRFTQPGSPDAILDWLRDQDYRDVVAVIVSTDMIAFGGLVASRTDQTQEDVAQRRLNRLAEIRKRAPYTRFYGMSAIMRLAPTATRASASWRLNLARYAEIQDRYRRTKERRYLDSLRNLLVKIPPLEIDRYDQTRARNHRLQQRLIKLVQGGALDYLVLGQDDAQPYGPHIPETERLRASVHSLGVGGKVYLCEGIDQLSNVLTSRALLKAAGWMPRVRILYSDDLGKKRIADYESKSVEASLRDQILASGARPMAVDGEYDYALYLNVPKPRANTFRDFAKSLEDEVDQGFPVAVADINLAKDGTADPELFSALWQNNRMMRLLSYAGWNTAGNTMGTAIPAANVYLLARRDAVDPVTREIAQRTFLLHRFVNDYAYHKFTRPAAYRMIDADLRASRDELYGRPFDEVNAFVVQDLTKHLKSYYDSQFAGRKFFAGSTPYMISGIEATKIFLPWPRAYEVRIEFQLKAVKAN